MVKKNYVFWYNEEITYKGYFEASSREEAEALLEQVQSGDVLLEDLPNFGKKEKEFNLYVADETLEGDD
jgi:hypothetical protein